LAVEACDVMLLELDLPGIDGFQVAQLIRRGDVGGEQVPIVALLVRGDKEEMTRGRQVGIDAFLHKPLNGTLLASALQEAMMARAAASKDIKMA
jgi:DNA-binding response OmpR family regulator